MLLGDVVDIDGIIATERLQCALDQGCHPREEAMLEIIHFLLILGTHLDPFYCIIHAGAKHHTPQEECVTFCHQHGALRLQHLSLIPIALCRDPYNRGEKAVHWQDGLEPQRAGLRKESSHCLVKSTGSGQAGLWMERTGEGGTTDGLLYRS